MKKIEKMVKAYNKCARRFGYDTISIDYENKKIVGEYTPRDIDEYKGFKGFFKSVFVGGLNGSMEEDYQRIAKRLEKITKR